MAQSTKRDLVNQSLKQSIASEVVWSFSRSSGPGGQHVNTTDSKAKLSWYFYKSEAVNNKQKYLISKKLNNYIKKDNSLQLSSSSNRKKELNQKDCLKKLFYLIENVAFKVEKKRLKTKPTRASKERRIKDKKVKSETKKNRKKVRY